MQLVQRDARGVRELANRRGIPGLDHQRPVRARVGAQAGGLQRGRSSCGRGVRTTTLPPAVSSETEPCFTIRPWWITTTSSTVCATSASTWLETSTVRPSPAIARRKSRSQRMPWGSRPLAGSSSTSTCGSPSSVAASPSRWRMPIEYLPTRRFAGVRASPRAAAPRPRASAAARPSPRSARRWLRPERPGCAPATSRFAPDRARRVVQVPVPAAATVACPPSAAPGRAPCAASWSCRRRWARESR